MTTLNRPALRNRGFAAPCYSIAIFSDDGKPSLIDIVYFEAASEADSLAAATAYFDAAVDAKFAAHRAVFG